MIQTMTWAQHMDTLTPQQYAEAAAADILRDYERGDYTEAEARQWLRYMAGLTTTQTERDAFSKALALLDR